MFEKDECRYFFEGAEQVMGRLYRRHTPDKERKVSYFWIKNGRMNKKFIRITNNFFVETK